MTKEYNDTEFCEHCKKDTMHLIYESGHERDSSNDWRQCLTCHWTWNGFDNKYHQQYPDFEADDIPVVRSNIKDGFWGNNSTGYHEDKANEQDDKQKIIHRKTYHST